MTLETTHFPQCLAKRSLFKNIYDERSQVMSRRRPNVLSGGSPNARIFAGCVIPLGYLVISPCLSISLYSPDIRPNFAKSLNEPRETQRIPYQDPAATAYRTHRQHMGVISPVLLIAHNLSLRIPFQKVSHIPATPLSRPVKNRGHLLNTKIPPMLFQW